MDNVAQSLGDIAGVAQAAVFIVCAIAGIALQQQTLLATARAKNCEPENINFARCIAWGVAFGLLAELVVGIVLSRTVDTSAQPLLDTPAPLIGGLVTFCQCAHPDAE